MQAINVKQQDMFLFIMKLFVQNVVSVKQNKLKSTSDQSQSNLNSNGHFHNV